MNEYRCAKCGWTWYSATDLESMKDPRCAYCGGKLEVAKGAEMAGPEIPPVEVFPGVKEGTKEI